MDQPINQTNITPNNQEPNWFNDLLTNYDYQTPQPGQLLEGTILRIDEDGIVVDIGVKRDAIVPARDLAQVDENTLSQLEAGDQIFVYVLNRPVGDSELVVSLSKGIEHESWEKAELYLKNGAPVELEIVGHNRGGLIVEFETLRGFLPYSQVPGLRGIRNPRLAERIKKEMVGTQLEMKVIEVVRERNRLIFSATAAEKEKRQKRLQELIKGLIITGKVVNIVDFGIFVDLDGIDGLVHLSELDWKKVKHPSEIFKAGEEIEVKVLDVDVERQRVSLSRKALLPSPWEIPEELPKAGDCIEGRVVKLVSFGAFVELPIGIEGLVHTSQIGYAHTESPKDALKRGEIVLVRVLDVDPTRRRISLSMRQVPRELQISWAMEHLDLEGLAGAEAQEPASEDQAPPDTEEQLPEEKAEQEAEEKATPPAAEQDQSQSGLELEPDSKSASTQEEAAEAQPSEAQIAPVEQQQETVEDQAPPRTEEQLPEEKAEQEAEEKATPPAAEQDQPQSGLELEPDSKSASTQEEAASQPITETDELIANRPTAS